MQGNYRSARLTRRGFIRGLSLAGGAAIATPLIGACGGSAKSNGGSGARSGTASSNGGAGGQPAGVLRMVHWQGPHVTDPAKDPSNDLIQAYGMGEGLTRVTPDVKIAPWLAERYETVDPVTTRIMLRQGMTFWDGSPVDSAAIKASLQRIWSMLPLAGALINKETQVETPDPLTIVLKTSEPQANVLNNLAAPAFTIHKQAGDGSVILSGPYKSVNIVGDQSITLEPYLQHWGDTGKIKRIDAKIVPDANVRALALQSGDTDFAWQLPVEQVDQLKSQFTIIDLPSLRIDTAVMNVTRPPFNDLAARRAFALAIDREALVKGVLLGAGKAEFGCFPSGFGVESVQAQKFDLVQAKQVLDQAGWTAGSDGVRQKNGQRLSFVFFSYPGRPETKPLTVAIQSQLKSAGFEIKPQEVPDVKAASQAQPDWGAAIVSINSLPTADPQYLFDYFYASYASSNYGHWANPAFDALVKQMRTEVDPTKKIALSKQVQDVMAQDAPAAYLVSKIFKAGTTKKVRGIIVQPHDDYLITTNLSISS